MKMNEVISVDIPNVAKFQWINLDYYCIEKICMEIVAKQKQAESEARISEQNSEEVKIEDIFSEVCSEKYVDDDEEVNIF